MIYAVTSLARLNSSAFALATTSLHALLPTVMRPILTIGT